MKIYVVLAVLLLSGVNAVAQEFSGKVSYEMTYEAKGEEELGMMTMMLPKTETLYIKGNRAKIVQESTMGKNTFIKDIDKDTTFVYLEMMGQKIQLLLSQDQIEKQYNVFKAKKIEYASGKKMIDKRICKRALMTYDDSLPAAEVYYLPNVVNSAYPMFTGLSGLPLTFSLIQERFVFTKKATLITAMDIADDMFDELVGFSKKTPEELQSMFGGFGGK
jgi:hypothetical protein